MHHPRGGYSAEEPQSLRRLKDGGSCQYLAAVLKTATTVSTALSIRYTPFLRRLVSLSSTKLVTMRRGACALWLSTPHMSRVRAENAASFSPPSRLWTHQSWAGKYCFIFSTPHILILLAAFLMLGAVAPAASANIVKSPSLLNDAGHSAAYTHGFLLGRSLLFLSKISCAVSTKDASRSATAERLYTHYGGSPPSLTVPANSRSRRRIVEHILKVKEGVGRPTKRLGR